MAKSQSAPARSRGRPPQAPPVAGGGSPAGEPAARPPRKGFWREVRELWDTLVLAFALVTLMKTFVIDLYKIPSGSMTPTLIGDHIAHGDHNGDGIDDLYLVAATPDGRLFGRQVFIRGADGVLRCQTDAHRTLYMNDPPHFRPSEVETRYDRILVNKMWYWFFPLERGDIVVFKLPDHDDPQTAVRDTLFNPQTPNFIKRVAALGGEVPTVDAQGRLVIDGAVVSEPDVYLRNHYFATDPLRGFQPLPFLGTRVPDGQFYVFGDNSGNSADSRYWGGVEIDRLRGRAFFRYWPLRHVSFLE